MSINIHKDQGNALWEQLTDSGCRAFFYGSGFLSKRHYTNFSEMLCIGGHSGLSDMMRASGVEEAYVTGGASDYHKLEALCKVLHLWSGHPYYAAIHALLRRVFGIDKPLTPQTLPEIWQQTAERLFESPLAPADLPALWGIKKTVTSLSLHDLTEISDEVLAEDGGEFYLHIQNLIRSFWYPPYKAPISRMTPAEDMAARVESFVDEYVNGRCAGIVLDLSESEGFMRPDPYSPAQAVLRLQSTPKTIRETELQMIQSQTLRLVASACVKRNLKLTILRADPAMLSPLCSYLHGCGCLPATSVAISHPYDLSHLGISSMMYLHKAIPSDFLADNLSLLATEMPLGAVRGMVMPLEYPFPAIKDSGYNPELVADVLNLTSLNVILVKDEEHENDAVLSIRHDLLRKDCMGRITGLA